MPHHAFVPGRIEAAAGRATVAYVEAALAFVRANHARAIVGCPHNEAAVNAAGIAFSGYPGLIARLSGMPEDRVFLMLVGGRLRILHATLHERLQNALLRLTPDLVEAAGLACSSALTSLGIEQPRIGLCAINPHAGEGGLFGDDDERITAPAAERLRRGGIAVEGPTGADILLGRTDLDGFVAMYHDQGHIPIKLIAGRTASALTVGAGIMFSSVGHGSAFDIAGRGIADPAGILRAVHLVSGFGAGNETVMTFDIRIAGSDIAFPCAADETVLDAVERAGYSIPYSCRKGVCSTCAGVLSQGAATVRHQRVSGPREGVLLCQAKPLSDLAIKPGRIEKRDPLARKRINASVFRLHRPTPDVIILQLRFPAGMRAKFRAGQYLRVIMADGDSRNFSMANPPHESDSAELHIRHVPGGRFSEKVLASLAKGDKLEVEIPFGEFFLRDGSAKPIVFVATGTGFAPIKSIVQDMIKRGIRRPAHSIGEHVAARIFICRRCSRHGRRKPTGSKLCRCSPSRVRIGRDAAASYIPPSCKICPIYHYSGLCVWQSAYDRSGAP